MTEVPARVAFGEALVELAAEDPRIVVLDGDLGNSTRVDIFAMAHPERFLQMGIAEQNMMGVAAGLAAGGMVPFATTFAVFATYRALDQIRVVIAQPNHAVVIVGSYSGLLAGRTGKTHVCLEDLAIFRAMPNMTVLAPGDADEVRRAVSAAVQLQRPVYMRITRDPSPSIGGDRRDFKIGSAVMLREGPDVAIISTGAESARAMGAAVTLASEGISAAVLHVPTIKPVDVDAIVDVARTTGAVVTAEDHSIVGGLGGVVAETLSEHLPTPLRRVGTRDVYAESGVNEDLIEKYGIGATDIVAAAREVMTLRG
jgi:transketolase